MLLQKTTPSYQTRSIYLQSLSEAVTAAYVPWKCEKVQAYLYHLFTLNKNSLKSIQLHLKDDIKAWAKSEFFFYRSITKLSIMYLSISIIFY